jgi:hypothetical protein
MDAKVRKNGDKTPSSPTNWRTKTLMHAGQRRGGQNHYGYKNHINLDKDTKLIARQACTDARMQAYLTAKCCRQCCAVKT